MKKKVSILIGACGLLLSSMLHASAGWTDYANVAELIPTSRHYYEFRLPVEDNPSGCREETWFYQNYDSTGSDQMFNVLLESIKSKIRLRVYVTGVCNIHGYSEISSVSVVPWETAAWFYESEFPQGKGRRFSATDQIARGDRDIDLHTDGKDELSAVTQSFMKMVEQIKHSEAMTRKYQLELEDANENLEGKVQRRTAALEKSNKQLIAINTKLQETKDKLVESEKMASIGELTAGLAHEIQNPLNFVNNFS